MKPRILTQNCCNIVEKGGKYRREEHKKQCKSCFTVSWSENMVYVFAHRQPMPSRNTSGPFFSIIYTAYLSVYTRNQGRMCMHSSINGTVVVNT